MNLSSEISILLSPPELFTLASLLGGKTLIGIPDPFPGWLTEEIQETMQAAQSDLVHKDYLRVEGDELKMDALVAALMGTLIQPQSVLLFTLSQPSAPLHQEGVYHRPPFIVHLSPQQDVYQLYPLAESEVNTLLRQRWGPQTESAAAGQPFSLPETELLSIRQALGAPSAMQILQRAGVSKDSVMAFLSTWQTAQRNGALVVIRQRDSTWQVNGLGFLESENGLWRLCSFQSNAQDWVECLPCSATEFWLHVATLLQRYFFEE